MERKRLTIREFLNLPREEQGNILFNEGCFVDHFLIGEKQYVLFSLNLFFVEVEYDIKRNKILDLAAFDSGAELEKYVRLKD